jgi:NADPH:quinone reductase-like Zn-dependent oxidoreductase
MKAIILQQPGTPDHLIYQELPTPAITEGEVLIQVKAISINPVDVKTRAGKGRYNMLKDLSPIILGWDISGIVTQTKSTKFKQGDEVFGMVNFPGHGKAYAEYVVAPAAHLALKPANISHQAAAAATLAALTAYQAIMHHAQVKPGQRVLIHAAAGGVGHYAVQIAKELGAYVIGTSSQANRDFVLSLGADEHLDYHAAPLETQTNNIDFSLDAIGGDNIDKTLPVMKPGSTLISIPSGLNDHLVEKAKAKGVNGLHFLVASNGEDMQALAALLESGRLKSYVTKTFTFDQMAQAHLQIETGRTTGKIVVTI